MEEFSLGNAVKPPHWEPLVTGHRFEERTLAETLLGGQAFRWRCDSAGGVYTGVWERNVVRLRLGPGGGLQMQRLTKTPEPAVLHYLGCDRIPGLIASLPCASDPVLARLREIWGGISLLRQPPGETLLAFICSANKRIPHIQAMLENLAERFGETIPGTGLKALPDWERLATVPEAELRACSLGYRARHVAGTAAFLAGHPAFLEETAPLPYEDARAALLRLPGVGPKVADCILLFGFGRTEAFPVDTWIARLMGQLYPDLADWDRGKLATFARIHYGGAAGLAQQWIFAGKVRPGKVS